jgi:hypothetical protein
MSIQENGVPSGRVVSSDEYSTTARDAELVHLASLFERDAPMDSTMIRAGLLQGLIAELQAARAALVPFAAIATDRNLAGHPDSYAPRPSRGRPNMADYRRAAAALAKAQP